MKIIGLSVLIWLYSFGICCAREFKEKSLNITNVKNQANRFEKYLIQGNTDSLHAVFDTNCIVSFPKSKLITSSDSLINYFADKINSGVTYKSFNLNSNRIDDYDSIVVEIGTLLERFATPPLKRLYIYRFNYQIVWKKSSGGDYHIHSAIFNNAKVESGN